MISRRKLLESLIRYRLLEVARAFEISGLTGKPKDEVVAELFRARTIELGALPARFRGTSSKRPAARLVSTMGGVRNPSWWSCS